MVGYNKFFILLEEAGPNKHLTHLEELVLIDKKNGAERAINYLSSLTEILDSNAQRSVNANIKFDGSPSFVIGKDLNNKFFVGSKSVFNKIPKINYSIKDIKNNHSDAPGLVNKLIQLYVNFKNSNIDSVYQGDFLFDENIKEYRTIEGENYISFKPNTILYAVPADSKEGKDIINSKIGVVFHTEYNIVADSENIPRFQIKRFGVDVSNIDPGPNVYVKDAFFQNDSGYITLTKEETSDMMDIINSSKQLIAEIDFNNIPDNIYSTLNTYINTEIREGQFIQDPQVSFQQYYEWFSDKLDKKISTLKSQAGKDKAQASKDQMLEIVERQRQNILNLFELQKLIKKGKDIFIKKYNNMQRGVILKHYLFDENGDLVVTDPEGYVCVDYTGNAVKFVDRLEFSKANFAVDKSVKFN